MLSQPNLYAFTSLKKSHHWLSAIYRNRKNSRVRKQFPVVGFYRKEFEVIKINVSQNHRKYNKVSTFRFTTKIPQPPTWGEGVN